MPQLSNETYKKRRKVVRRFLRLLDETGTSDTQAAKMLGITPSAISSYRRKDNVPMGDRWPAIQEAVAKLHAKTNGKAPKVPKATKVVTPPSKYGFDELKPLELPKPAPFVPTGLTRALVLEYVVALNEGDFGAFLGTVLTRRGVINR